LSRSGKRKRPSGYLSMSYNLEFKESALKEWGKLDRPIREQFKKKLSKRLENPKVEADKVSGLANTYKIKLRAVGKRDKMTAYRKAKERA